MEWPGRKELEQEGKTISLGKDPGAFGNDRGRKDQQEERKIISPGKALPPSISRALSREQVGIDPRGSVDGCQRAHQRVKHKWNLRSERTENSKCWEIRDAKREISECNKAQVPVMSTQVSLMSIPEQTSVQFPLTGEVSSRSTAERHGGGQNVSCGAPGAPVGSSSRSSPKTWSRTQLLLRLTELEGVESIHSSGTKETPPLRQAEIMINKAARKKSVLVDFMQSQLGLVVNATDTIEQLKVKAMNQAYACSPAHPEDHVGFGQHSALTYREVAMEMTSYLAGV